MEKQETKSKWDDLAREIGAELSPEAEQRAETHAVAAESGGISASASPPAVRPPLPKKPAADWVGLSSELGLPPLEEEPQPTETPLEKPLRPVEPPDQSRESHTRKSHTSESHSREPQQREPQQRESRPRERSDRDSRSRGRRGRGGGRRGERQDVERDSGESNRHQREADHRRRDRPQGRRGSHEQPRSHDESRHETSEPRREPKPREFDSASFGEPVEERPTVAETPPPPFAPEPPAKSPAVSLWHKIFGAPAEPPSTVADTQAEEASEFGTAQQRFESPDVFHGSEIRSFSGEDVPTADFVDEGSIESTPADEEDESIELKRGRSRRRRRGGRGRKPGRGPRDAHPAEPRVHESGGDDQLNAEFDDLEDDDGDLADEDHFDAARPGTGDSDLEDSEREHGSSHSRSLSATQRAIPTWDDAIGFIVESNMQSRSQRRPPSRSDSRGNASRGRPRGRRK